MVVSPSMAQGTCIVAPFAPSTILFSREVLTIEIAFQNGDDFIRNLVHVERRTACRCPAGF